MQLVKDMQLLKDMQPELDRVPETPEMMRMMKYAMLRKLNGNKKIFKRILKVKA